MYYSDFSWQNLSLEECSSLERLASECGIEERRFSQKRETLLLNTFYGNALQVKDFCGLDRDQPLYTLWPHGIHYSGEVPLYDLQLPVIITYCRETMLSAFDTVSSWFLRQKPLVVGHAPPFSLACRNLRARGIEISEEKGSAVYFLSHSSLVLDIGTSDIYMRQITKDLRLLKERYDTVSLCVYWKDHLSGAFKELYQIADRVLTAGHMFDDMFLARLAIIISSHTCVSGSGFGSYIAYGLACHKVIAIRPGNKGRDSASWSGGKSRESIKMEKHLVDSKEAIFRREAKVLNTTDSSTDDYGNARDSILTFGDLFDPRLIRELNLLGQREYYSRKWMANQLVFDYKAFLRRSDLPPRKIWKALKGELSS